MTKEEELNKLFFEIEWKNVPEELKNNMMKKYKEYPQEVLELVKLCDNIINTNDGSITDREKSVAEFQKNMYLDEKNKQFLPNEEVLEKINKIKRKNIYLALKDGKITKQQCEDRGLENVDNFIKIMDKRNI